MAQDYNIYIRNVGGGGSQASSPTTPWQMNPNAENQNGSGKEIVGDGFSAATSVTAGAAFLRGAGSIISKVMSTPAGQLGAGAFAFLSVVNGITTKAVNFYQSFAAPASGDYKFQIDYGNFQQQIHNFFHPLSTEIQRQHASMQFKKENLANEQERLLLGGTYLNTPYGRYL